MAPAMYKTSSILQAALMLLLSLFLPQKTRTRMRWQKANTGHFSDFNSATVVIQINQLFSAYSNIHGGGRTEIPGTF